MLIDRQLKMKLEQAVCIYVYISTAAHFHVGSLFLYIMHCSVHVTSVRVSASSDGQWR